MNLKQAKWLILFLFIEILSLKAQDLSDEEKREASHYRRLYNIGQYTDINPDSALRAYNAMEIYFNELSDSLKIRFLIDREFANFRLGNFEECINDLADALDISNRRDTQFAEEIHLAFGHLYYAIDSISLAIQSYHQSIALAKAKSDTSSIIPAYDGLGNTYQDLEMYDSAKYYFEQNMEMVKNGQNNYFLSNVYANYATLLFELGEVKEAIKYQLDALILEKENQDSVSMIFSYANLGYYHFASHKELSQKYIDTAFLMANHMELYDYLRELNEGFSVIEEEHGNYKEALEYFKAYHKFSNELINKDMVDRVKGWEITLDNQEKDAEINLLQQLNTYEARQKRMLWFGIGGLLLLLCVMVWLALQLQKNRKQLSIQNEQLSELNNTKDKFFSIIAHDLRSPMIALQGVGQKLEYYIKRDKQEKLLEMGGKIDQSIDHLNNLLNNLLNWAASQTEGIPYHPEQVNLQQLIDENLQLFKSLAESKGIELINQNKETPAYVDINTVSTVIRNVLSNAIKFSPENEQVIFECSETSKHSVMSITDRGKGMKHEQLEGLFSQPIQSQVGTLGEKGFGLGLKLCREFMQMNHGFMQVKSEPGHGTTIELHFPKQAAGHLRKLA